MKVTFPVTIELSEETVLRLSRADGGYGQLTTQAEALAPDAPFVPMRNFSTEYRPPDEPAVVPAAEG